MKIEQPYSMPIPRWKATVKKWDASKPESMSGLIRKGLKALVDDNFTFAIAFPVHDVGKCAGNFYIMRKKLGLKEKVRIIMDWDNRRILVGPHV